MPLRVVERRKGYGFANNSAEELNRRGECAAFESVSCPHKGIIPKAHELPGNAAVAEYHSRDVNTCIKLKYAVILQWISKVLDLTSLNLDISRLSYFAKFFCVALLVKLFTCLVANKCLNTKITPIVSCLA